MFTTAYRILLLIVVSLVVSRTAYGDRRCVTATGKLECHRKPREVSRKMIYMYDLDETKNEEGGSDDFMGRTRTDKDGKFTIQGCGYDKDTNGTPNPPDPYLELEDFCTSAEGEKRRFDFKFKFAPEVNDIGVIVLDKN
ncbi:unnamed protein product [Soboliphyme baturini]|uniref:Transthyretin-like family protein n=1 Tax=Soboliphyme baturini TaxID=241478 RepID=A0A183IG94_9BILA|nr:unnamed protein product [Soboliphyme baturini]